VPVRHPGTDPSVRHVNLLLLPWPLRVRESDFRPLEGSVQRLPREPFGFFEFAPAEVLDLDLVDRMLVAARDEVESVDVVVLPESAVEEGEIDDLEALLDRHGVISLITGVRQRSQQTGRFPGNWVHIGINPRLEQGGPLQLAAGEEWFHIRQNKHHRWSLDEAQIYQYHLGGALHPHIRWIEAMEVPRRSVQFLEFGEDTTLVSLVCEDLAQIDEVAEIIRSVGPTVVVTPLLDGPQLTSRWAARYASVLADDPGSAVLTLSSYGMVQRSRPHAHDASPVIALWKDPARGTREIALEAGAQGVLLTACGDSATRRSADGRWPVENGSHFFDVAVHQVQAASVGSQWANAHSGSPSARLLEVEDLTVLTGWAEAVAEALAYAPERVASVLSDARAGAAWRDEFGLCEPSPALSAGLEQIDQAVWASAKGAPSFEAVLFRAREAVPGEGGLARLVRRVLRSALEQFCTRQAKQA
jgi:hypothetical protein